MKKLYVLALATLSFNAIAEDEVAKFKAQFKAQYKLLDNEIRIVKLKDYMKPSIKNDEDRKRVTQSITKCFKQKKNLMKKGTLQNPAQ